MVSRSIILIVDDDERLLKMLSTSLIREGFQVATATDGPQTIEFARGKTPDLILLDLLMPGMNGFEILSQIREESDVPVIILTGIDDPAVISKAMRAGADDFVIKPFSTKELIARVNAKLRRSSAPLDNSGRV
jgi:DNA-binding response OmpR family regulator